MSSRLLEDLRKLTRTAGFRLALSYSVFFTVSCVLFFGFAYFLLASSLAKRDHEDILYKFWDLTAEYQTFDKDGLERAMTTQGPQRKLRSYFIQYSLPGAPAANRLATGPWQEFDLAALDQLGDDVGEQWISLPSRRGDSVLEVTSLRLSDGLLLQVGQTNDERRELLGRLRRIVLLTMVLVILMSLPGGYLLARHAMRPVRDLIATIKKIEAGAVGERVPAGRGEDEFDELGRLFNGMLARIETLIAGMRGALDNVAHDLRTPLTRLRAGAEQALASQAGLDASREALADCVEESDRVVGMVSTLMDISEAETGLMKLKLETVDLAVLVEEAVEMYRYPAEEKGVEIEYLPPAPVQVSTATVCARSRRTCWTTRSSTRRKAARSLSRSSSATAKRS